MNSLLTDYLSRVTLGEPQQFRQLAIFPVFAPNGREPNYLVLAEALQQKLVTLTETSQAGQVPKLKLANRAVVPVLLIEGEELIGSKQNRVLNTTVLAREQSEMIIPVTCTEAGRWHYSSPSFGHSGHLTPLRLRRSKSTSVSAALQANLGYASDQGWVWNEIHCLEAASSVKSPSHALHDILKAKEADLAAYLDALQPVPGQKGLLVMIAGQVAGLDILASARVYRAMHGKFVRSYAFDAVLGEEQPAVEPARRESSTAFFEESKRCTEETYPSVGRGADHRFAGGNISGFALVDEGQVVHLNLYRN